MSLAAACGWSLARSIAVALLAWPISRRQSAWLRNLPAARRSVVWCLVMLPFLVPELWTGYAYSGFALLAESAGIWGYWPLSLFPSNPQWALARSAAIDELLLDVLLLLRAIPVGTLVAWFAPPPPLSAEAIYCFRLARHSSPISAIHSFPTSAWERLVSKLRFASRPGTSRRAELPTETREAELRQVRSQAELGNEYGERVGPGRSLSPPLPLSLSSFNARQRLRWRFALLRNRLSTALPATGLMFLLCFQEFELASLIGRPAWTVWLFDAQVGGLALAESLRRALFPVLCQLLVILPLVAIVAKARSLPTAARAVSAHVSRLGSVALWTFAVLSLTITALVPFLLVGKGTFQGLLFLFRNMAQLRMLVREILIGTGYALLGAIAAALAAAWLLHVGRDSKVGRTALLAAALPGLFGSLILGLGLIRLLQQPVLQSVYKTPVSLIAGLMLFLMPRALILRFALWSSRTNDGSHVAALLRESSSRRVRGAARELAWQLRWRGEFWSLALLSYWGFLDLTIAFLLSPVTIVSTPVMLYNQMHFGKNAALSARACLAVLLPALLFVLIASARRLVPRWLWR